MAAEFPDARVVGFDISPIQPKTIRPPNVDFEIMNVLEGKQTTILLLFIA
jgi:hypothetical protein